MTPLRYKLKAIRDRLSDIDFTLPMLQGQDYRGQEMRTERNILLMTEASAQRALSPEKPTTEQRQRRRNIIDGIVAERSETIAAFISRLEREGDFRQARIWRSALLDVRDQVEKEMRL